MKKILTLWPVVAMLVSGCASKPIRNLPLPSPTRLELLKKSILLEDKELVLQNPSEVMAKAYLEAIAVEKQGNTKLACKLFTKITEEKSSPLKEEALIHTLDDCDLSPNSLLKIWKNTSISNYLKETYNEISLKLAKKNNLLLPIAQFSYELIPNRSTQADKIKLIKRSIEIAEKLEDQEKIVIYNDRLKEISPLYNTEINDKNIYLIARDFEANRKFETARSMYKQIIDGEYNITDKVKAYNAYRTSFKVERNLKTFLIATFEMEKFLKDQMNKNPEDQISIDAWVDSKITLARAVWTDHRNSEAQAILDELIMSKLGTENQKATTQLIYGSLLIEMKNYKSALKHYETAVSFKLTDNALSENIQWAIVWNNYLLKKYKKVTDHVNTFIQKSANTIFISKLNFWKAKALLHLHKKQTASDLFLKIITDEPYGYYGIISAMELAIPLSPIKQTEINLAPTKFLTLAWLVAMGEKTFSQKYLKEVDPQFKSPKDRERAMSLYAQTEWYQGGMRQIFNFKMSSRNEMTEKYINIVFPTPYLDLIESMANKYSIPKELVFAIARQESAFVPSERSWADAFGLMQIIPEKAIELSKKHSIPFNDYNDLYNPEINIEMGTAFLKDLRQKFNGKFAQSVAAYNASENAIRTWEKERFNGDYIEFIEMVPYEETRNYIKLVFRNYIIYKRIIAKDSFTIDKNFFANPF